MATQLVTVNSKTTAVARFAGAIAYVVNILVILKIVPLTWAAAIIGFTNTDLFTALVACILFTVTTLLPAIQGWRSRDKELPEGVQITDVEIASGTPGTVQKAVALSEAKSKAIADGAAKTAAFLLCAGLVATTLSACRTSCPPVNQSLAYPIAKLTQMQTMEAKNAANHRAANELAQSAFASPNSVSTVICDGGVCSYVR